MTLADRRVVVTRAPHQADELADKLRQHGAEPLLFPCIDICPPDDTTGLDDALQRAADGGFDWIVITSSNTVEAIRQRAATLGLNLAGQQAAVVGPATATAARDALDLNIKAVPDNYVAEALAQTLDLAPDKRVWLPQGDLARSTLADQLTSMRAQVTVVTAYHTVIGHGGIDLPAALRSDTVDAMTFTSSSTVENCLRRVEQEDGDVTALQALCAVCIGPKTADTAHHAGFQQVLTPDTYTLDGMIDLLERHFNQTGT
ncbi:MAG: hypothetical protein CL610_10990 [Anaerolineaceae bacterium]|nr:hypothetical protein [Anaerolineaceae bacterium]